MLPGHAHIHTYRRTNTVKRHHNGRPTLPPRGFMVARRGRSPNIVKLWSVRVWVVVNWMAGVLVRHLTNLATSPTSPPHHLAL
ncbi:hypothetical protein E2C01_084139 [Portunus trituberculatus]|uniref:Uncharacterized protein n=1 Tax=Portunus trituberculatus TaxID=210409 RepID=A0A5B7J419_PORTR|nr:hypothetical protein [Portunus trituberculatus]